jgi:hypothetical protein
VNPPLDVYSRVYCWQGVQQQHIVGRKPVLLVNTTATWDHMFLCTGQYWDVSLQEGSSTATSLLPLSFNFFLWYLYLAWNLGRVRG